MQTKTDMKAVITLATYNKEITTKFGVMHQHYIEYDGKRATYLSKKIEQTYFVEGQECEFTEELKGQYLNVKPFRENKGSSNYSRAIKKEQSKYSGFAVSYVKDLIIADKIKIEDWEKASKKIFDFMVNLDKEAES